MSTTNKNAIRVSFTCTVNHGVAGSDIINVVLGVLKAGESIGLKLIDPVTRAEAPCMELDCIDDKPTCKIVGADGEEIAP